MNFTPSPMQALGILYSLCGRRRYLMGDHRLPMRKRVAHKIIVGDLEKGVDCRWLMALARGPRANAPKRREYWRIRREKEPSTALRGPRREIVGTRCNLIGNLLDAEDRTRCVIRNQPVPECWAEI